ncbi:MAG: Phosphate transport system permease protein PstC (TC 3.A.1.7.1) [uncultured Thiotrichaceae bacterium]|uniref:Phosphate transport system permease protein n=1 Tax=uncultured Thiotrichaceae bacterium TaxID=298394 RepID=A0A6S6SMT6_9GAMM|nr:MAG: Phosphate transport system permease protein PstC (TC 3.A.1.7.1) [uncultured Thiotrichaceae bacterium]
MQTHIIIITLLALLAFSYFTGRKRSIATASLSKGRYNLHSRPQYYGMMVVLWAGLPALLILFLWTAFDSTVVSALTVSQLPEDVQALSEGKLSLFMNEVKNIVDSGNVSDDTNKQIAAEHYKRLSEISLLAKTVVVFVIAVLIILVALRSIKPTLQARNHVERVMTWLMIACASIAILTTVGIVFSVIFEAIQFFKAVPVTEFLFGTHWSPQTAIRADQVGGSGSFGAIPLFVGTLLISLIALTIAVPLGLMSAIYLSEYASARFRAFAKPMLEILAGIPTVVYGFFAALTVAPFIRSFGESIGLEPSSESALAAGIVMGVMIIPFVSSLSDDVISAVPQAMRDGSYGMGATKSETITQVVIPAALPGIVGGVLLAASRAIGETMIVVMAAGLAANLTVNPLEAVTTVTVQIVTLLTGDQEFDSPKTLAAFALGLGLFMVTLILNIISLHVVRKYREQYD